MVYESLGKGLVVQGKNTSPPMHPTWCDVAVTQINYPNLNKQDNIE